MAVGFVQSISNSATSLWTTTGCTPTFAAPATSGNLVVVCVGARGNRTFTASDEFTWNTITNTPLNSGTNVDIIGYWRIAGGSEAASQGNFILDSATIHGFVIAMEFSGVDTTTPFAATGSQTDTLTAHDCTMTGGLSSGTTYGLAWFWAAATGTDYSAVSAGTMAERPNTTGGTNVAGLGAYQMGQTGATSYTRTATSASATSTGFWIVLQAPAGTTLSRTATPVTMAIEAAVARTATPVTFALQQVNARTATPVTMAIRQVNARTATPVTLAVAIGAVRTATPVTFAIQQVSARTATPVTLAVSTVQARTATPVTLAIATLLARTATPVTFAIDVPASGVTRSRTATPVTLAIAQAEVRTASPVTLAIQALGVRTATPITFSISTTQGNYPRGHTGSLGRASRAGGQSLPGATGSRATATRTGGTTQRGLGGAYAPRGRSGAR